VGLLIVAFAAWEISNCGRTADAETSPRPKNIEARDLVMLPNVTPAIPMSSVIEILADAIWVADSSGRRTFELSADGAHKIATAIYAHCSEPFLVGGLAWFESGFRMTSTSPSGRHFGLYHVFKAADPGSVNASTEEACDKMDEWRERCASKGHDHDWLAHWFGGADPSPRALLSARVVRKRARLLRSYI
jgi:hypothetical protein